MTEVIETPSQAFRNLRKMIHSLPDAKSITQLDINKLQVEAYSTEDELEKLTERYKNLLLKYAELVLELSTSKK